MKSQVQVFIPSMTIPYENELFENISCPNANTTRTKRYLRDFHDGYLDCSITDGIDDAL